MRYSLINKCFYTTNKKFNKKNSYSDICFSHDYAELYEIKEDGETQTFSFYSIYGKVEHTFLKRKIPMKVDGKQYYDITTAYGYGGPITSQVNNIESLLEEYYAAFQEYCSENFIVSEFIRFHLFENEKVRKFFYGEVGLIGPHISRDLQKPFNKDLHKSIRTSFRKAEKLGLSVEFDTTSESMNEFIEVYNETMSRNGAKNFYYFDESFFTKLHSNLDGRYVYAKALLNGKVISSFLVLYGEKYAYAFLAGTLNDYLKYDASTFLECHTIQWLKDKGLHYYNIGGGYEGEDGVFKYKKKFDKTGSYPFYVGKKIHDQNIYNKLTNLRSNKNNYDSKSMFFPLYRI